MSSPLKVMELCLSDGLGGLELYVYHAAVQLRRRGISVLPVVRVQTMLADRMAAEGLEPYTMTKASRYLPLISAVKLARLVERKEIDLIHVHWGKDMLLATLIKRLACRPIRLVYTRQMMITRPKKDGYHRFVYSQLDLLLTITDELLQLNRDYLPMAPAQIQRLYYGVEAAETMTAEERQAVRLEFGCSHRDTFLVGLVGRVEELKGQHLLVEAVANLRSEGHDIQAVIIGPSMDQGYLQRLQQTIAERGLTDSICIFGGHPRPTAIMQAFECVVLATRQETFGLVLAEAMRAGVAVVGTDAGGVVEIIEDGVSGLRFAPDSVEGLTAALRTLLLDPERRAALALAGKLRADEKFALKQHYDALLNHFDGLCSL